jgi:hypothetical protein
MVYLKQLGGATATLEKIYKNLLSKFTDENELLPWFSNYKEQWEWYVSLEKDFREQYVKTEGSANAKMAMLKKQHNLKCGPHFRKLFQDIMSLGIDWNEDDLETILDLVDQDIMIVSESCNIFIAAITPQRLQNPKFLTIILITLLTLPVNQLEGLINSNAMQGFLTEANKAIILNTLEKMGVDFFCGTDFYRACRVTHLENISFFMDNFVVSDFLIQYGFVIIGAVCQSDDLKILHHVIDAVFKVIDFRDEKILSGFLGSIIDSSPKKWNY